jgi:hypothetical protein
MVQPETIDHKTLLIDSKYFTSSEENIELEDGDINIFSFATIIVIK